MRVLWIVGSFGDGRCGVGDHVFRLWRELCATLEIGVVARGDSLREAGRLNQLSLVGLEGMRVHPGISLSGLEPAELLDLPQPVPTDLAGLMAWSPPPADGPEEEVSTGNRPPALACFGLESFSFRHWPEIRRVVEEFSPHLVHLFYPARGFRLSPLANLIPLLVSALGNRPPLVVTLYELSRAHPLRKLSLVSLVKQADLLVMVSEDELPWVEKIYGRRGATVVIPAGAAPLDGVGEEGITTGATPPRGGDFILYFGFPSRTKGLGYLIRALAVLRSWGIELPLLLGTDPDSRRVRKLVELAERLGVDHLVEVVGYLSAYSLRRISSGAMALVFPFTDGFTTSRSSLLNALLLPAPVVTTQREARFPLLSAPPRSAEGLAVRLAELWEQSRGEGGGEVRQRLIGIQRWLAHRMSIKRVARAYLATYNSLL